MFHMLFLVLSFYIENYCELCVEKHINNCFLLLSTMFLKNELSFFTPHLTGFRKPVRFQLSSYDDLYKAKIRKATCNKYINPEADTIKRIFNDYLTAR